MSIRRLAVLGAGLALGAAIFLPAVSAQQAPRQQTPADFRLAVDLVTTDVIARDARDQFVADLTKDEIEIFEDGVKQDLASMTLVHGGRVLNLQAPPPPPA